MRRGAVLAAAGLAIALFSGCASSRQGVLSLFPDAVVPGAGSPSAAGRLYEGMEATAVIDGGIVSYQEFGFRSMAVRDYRSGAAEITVEIYEMEDPAAAFGAYALGRDPKNEFLELGNQGWVFKTATGTHVAEFWKGVFYVRVEGRMGATREGVLALAGAIAGRIRAAGLPPAVLWRLHLFDAPPNSAQFFRGPLAFERACPEILAKALEKAETFEGFAVPYPAGRVFAIRCPEEGKGRRIRKVRDALFTEWVPVDAGAAPGPLQPFGPVLVRQGEGKETKFGAVIVENDWLFGVLGADRPETLRDLAIGLRAHVPHASLPSRPPEVFSPAVGFPKP
ncbi:MAG: DUF6599 family protein [Planctomycetota bacterium]